MDIKIFCVFLFLFSSIQICGACMLPEQQPGNCTSCLPTQLLQNGSCYEKIRGCLDQRLTLCVTCQNGYVFSNSSCVKQADYYNLTNLNPPPSTIIETSLNVSAIQPIIVGGYSKTTNFSSQFYLAAVNQLYLDYAYLKPFTIVNVDEQVVSGMNYMISIVDPKLGDSYSAQIYVNLSLFAKVNSVYKNQNLVTIGQNLSTIQNDSIPGGWKLFTNYTDQRYIDSKNTMLNYNLSFVGYTISKVEYQVVAGLNFLFYLQKNSSGVVVQVFNPLYGSSQVLKTWQSTTTTTPIVDNTTNNPQTGNYQNLDSNYTSNPNYVAALSVLTTTYPVLNNAVVTKVQEQIVAGVNYIINFQQINSTNKYETKVFVPLPYTQLPPQINYMLKNGQTYNPPTIITSTNNTSNSSVNLNNQAGSYSIDTSYYSDPNFMAALAKAQASYPILINASVTKVQSQVVAGMNFIINLKPVNSSDNYEVKVFVPLAFTQQAPQIDYILKNGVTYSAGNTTTTTSTGQVYNWQTDSVFNTLYNYFKVEVNIVNLTPILQVQRANHTSTGIAYFQYKIIYSTYQYAVVRYYPEINLFKVVSYIADGTDIYQLTKTNTSLPVKSEYNLQMLIQNSNSTLFSSILIQNVQQIALQNTFNVYIITATVQDGTYLVKVLCDQADSIYNIAKLSNDTCFTINTTPSLSIATHQQYVRDQLVQYLNSKYNFSGYLPTLSVVNYNSNSTFDYRILFSRVDYKEVVVKVEGINDKYTIKQLLLLNQGLAVVNSSTSQSVSLITTARNSIYSSLLKTASLIAIKYNGQKYELTFADSARLYNYTQFNSSTTTLQSTIFSGQVACQNAANTLCQSCPVNGFLWSGKCYAKLQSCDIQAGNLCVVCSTKSVLKGGKCLSNCSDIFA